MTGRGQELAQGCPPQASTPHLPGCRWAFLEPGQGMPGRCACVLDSRKRSGCEQSSRFSGLHIALQARWKQALQAGWTVSCRHTVPLPQESPSSHDP